MNCNVHGCDEPGRHRWRFDFGELPNANHHVDTVYCNGHSQARGETSPISEYLGSVEA